MPFTSETPSSEIPAPQSGIMRIGGGTRARAVGPLVIVPFPPVSSVANAEDGTTVLARVHVNSAHRVRRVYGAASAAGAATGTFDVFTVGDTPASIVPDAAITESVAASAVLSSTGVKPTDGDTVTIGAETYTFKDALSSGPAVAFEVLIGASAATALDNLKSAVNASAGAGTTYGTGTTGNADVTATTNTDTAQTFVATVAGAAGNALDSTVVSTGSVLSFAGLTFAGGVSAITPGVFVLAADTVYSTDTKDLAPVVGDPSTYTLRANTEAASASFTNLQVYLEVELLS